MNSDFDNSNDCETRRERSTTLVLELKDENDPVHDATKTVATWKNST